VDPLAGKYPAYSPYNYVLNNPLNMFDPNGLNPILKRKWWYLLPFTPRVYLYDSEITQWYSRLETAKSYYASLGYSGITNWISNNDFQVTIYNYTGSEANIGGQANVDKNSILLNKDISQNIINIAYAHELAHNRGYSEVGAYATTAALYGNGGKNYIINRINIEINSNPKLLNNFPKHLLRLWKLIIKKKGMSPEAASNFYEEYQNWGKNILNNFNKSDNLKKATGRNNNSSNQQGGWEAEYQNPPW